MNMLRIFSSFTAVMLLTAFTGNAQDHDHYKCGAEMPEHMHEYMEKYYETRAQFKSGSIVYFPVKAHIIRRTNGSGGLSLANLMKEIDTMNSFYINAGLQFYLCDGINYIDSDYYFDFHRSMENALGSANDVSKMINIYFANTVTSSNGDPLCGYAYYPGGPDRILMRNSCAINGSTLAHEMGHFFALIHTHGPSNSSLTKELVNGSNCQTTGDKICDTPADPQLSNSNVNTNCIYTDNNTKDDNGDLFQPDVTNIMSYSRRSCRNSFSQGQYDVVHYTSRFTRNYFTCSDKIVTENVQQTSFCGGTSFGVAFTTSSLFDTSNIFIVQLSNSDGNFTNPVQIGEMKGNSSGSIPVTIPSTTSAGDNYRLRVVASNPISVGSDNGNNLKIYATPHFVIDDKINVCGDKFDLTNAFIDLSNSPGDVTFWKDSSKTISITSPHEIKDEGKYYIHKITTDGNCQASKEVELSFHPLPDKPTITLEGFHLKSSSPIGNQWFKYDGLIAGATAQTLLPPYNTNYWVVVSDSLCSSKPSDEFQYTLSSAGKLSHEEVKIHPNPAQKEITINYMPSNSSAGYHLTDIKGRIILEGRLANDYMTTVDVRTVADGFYILKVIDGNKLLQAKFLKY